MLRHTICPEISGLLHRPCLLQAARLQQTEENTLPLTGLFSLLHPEMPGNVLSVLLKDLH